MACNKEEIARVEGRFTSTEHPAESGEKGEKGCDCYLSLVTLGEKLPEASFLLVFCK